MLLIKGVLMFCSEHSFLPEDIMTVALITVSWFVVHKMKLFACYFILYLFFIAIPSLFYTCIRTFLVDLV